MSKIQSESLSDMVFGFLDDEDTIVPASCSSDESRELDIVDEYEDGEKDDVNLEKDIKFWENQQQLLQATLYRTNSFESRIRSATKEAMKEILVKDITCACGKTMSTSCRNCLLREVSRRLQNAGFNSAVCKTKWRSSSDIPSGEYTFLDVVKDSGSSKGETRVIIELTFRAQFEMARASEDYNKLIEKLPEVFVGKVERLQNVIKILCVSGKKCMKERKMHMGPWRKHRYMQAKWLGTCERTTSTISLTLGHSSNRLPKPRASMLTFDLLEKLPGIQCTAVEVV